MGFDESAVMCETLCVAGNMQSLKMSYKLWLKGTQLGKT